MFIYCLIILLMSALCGISLYFLLKNFVNKKDIILKSFSIVLFIVMLVRYLIEEPNIMDVRGLNMYSPFGVDIISTVIGLLLTWFTYASVLILVLYSFFQLNNLKNFLKFFSAPVFLLDIVFFKTYMISISNTAFNKGDVRTILCMIEIILSLAMIGALFAKKDYFKVSLKEIKTLLISIVPILLAIMPGYTLQGLIGFKYTKYLDADSLSFEHRLLLYFSIIIPVTIYFALKEKDEETRRFSMIYLSLATLWTFMIRFNFNDWAESPTEWPLHLCNTAMYIIPICLIFRMNRLFYFTFFINVMGAFLAMAMPNTSAESNILSLSTYNFWINHFCAFFMPVLLVALKQFERPKLKQWSYSMISFFVYFVAILTVNAWFSNYGDVDFFFLNSDFIVGKLGSWAVHTQDLVWTFQVKGLTLTFYPVYQALFFFAYILISLAMWFLYEQLFQMWDLSADMQIRKKEYEKIQKELAVLAKKRGDNMQENVKPCLELKKFSKRYGSNKYYSVKDASLKVEGGTIFGFLGHNGAGKSTIIKSIVGIQSITSGSIEICGYDVYKQPVEAKSEIGFVPDHYALYENLTGREYINYIADLYGVSKEDRDARINKYLKSFELEEAFDNQIKSYSHGMKQKITIMSALVHNPKVWILDEPLTGLDPNSIYQVKECMKEHAREGNIVFFSSHIIDVVEKICDRIAIIKKGKIVCEANVQELEKNGTTLEQFYMDTNSGMTKKVEDK